MITELDLIRAKDAVEGASVLLEKHLTATEFSASLNKTSVHKLRSAGLLGRVSKKLH